MNIRSASVLGCGVLLTLASCGSSKAVTTAAPAAAPAATAPGAATTQPAAAAAAVPQIYNFKTNKVGGGAVDGAEFAGKPIAFWFWAPTWATCNAEAPSVEVVAKKFAGKVTVVGVAWQGDDKSFQGFVSKHKLTFTNLADLDDSLYAHFGVPSQPAWVFVNSKGVAKRAVGVVPEATLDKVLTDLV